jgi:hypothetical protein
VDWTGQGMCRRRKLSGTKANHVQRSYKEYKDMLPAYKKSEQLRQAVAVKEEEIKNLQLQLINAKTSQSNGVGTGGDAAFWKNKYDGLLSSIGG